MKEPRWMRKLLVEQLLLLDELKEIRRDLRAEIYGAPFHVHPRRGAKHKLSGTRCWCEPTVRRRLDGVDVIVHNREN